MFWSHFQDIFQMIILNKWILESVLGFRDWAKQLQEQPLSNTWSVLSQDLIIQLKFLNLVPHTTLLGKKVGGPWPPCPPQFCRAWPVLYLQVVVVVYAYQNLKWCIRVNQRSHNRLQRTRMFWISKQATYLYFNQCKIYTMTVKN